MMDVPCQDHNLVRQHPAYFRPNLWPKEHLPQLKDAFQDLGRLIVHVGMLLMEHCDRYVEMRNPTAQPGKLLQVLHRSRNHKARLLHYFPAEGSEPSYQQAGGKQQQWCGWHMDHGSLTGLTSAMYIKGNTEVPNPDPASGLYIKDRHGEVIKALIPPGHVAYQVGEAMQIHSGGLLRATPHCVKAAAGRQSSGISRNTLAVFMQPDVTEPMDVPEGVNPEEVAVGQWQPGMDFGTFSEATFKKYYR